jgi:two-component system, sensor histidine kinase and response regulator
MAAIVLVVDDEQPVADVIRLLVEDLGHHVFTAFNGVEALELAQREKPRLVISDIMMPHMSGDELCRRLKSEPSLGSVKVILMSAAGSVRTEGTGADAFLHKPFDLETVEQLVMQFTASGG